LSSTTDRRDAEDGQILVLFAGALVLILAVAALVFDVGQNLLDRRTEQNVSDAAALAGAQYAQGAAPFHGFCAAAPGGNQAVQAACQIAAQSGYVDGVGARHVRVDVPPIFPSIFSGIPSHVEVTISSDRPSFFAGVLGVANQNVGAKAVAKTGGDVALPYSLLALDPHGCGTNKINGAPGTIVTTNGTVHVDSDCSTDAVLLAGNGVLSAPQCDVVGEIQTSGGAKNLCSSAPDGVLVSGDPLRTLPPPAKPALPAPVQALDGGTIPSGCPGGAPPAATEAAPKLCAFSSGGQKDKTFRIFPGLYPGGLETTRGIVYMSPGIYWVGGGGVSVKSTGGADGRLISKALGDNLGATPSGGVLIYNTWNPITHLGYAPITLNGGAGANLSLRPIQDTQYKGMVMFIDRVANPVGATAIDLNGGGSILNVTGTMYSATGQIKFNGSATDVISAQVICYNFQVNGSGATFTINYQPNDLFHLTGIGLVQ
jgi:hypothetical protein